MEQIRAATVEYFIGDPATSSGNFQFMNVILG
jgi:hypothetical protein